MDNFDENLLEEFNIGHINGTYFGFDDYEVDLCSYDVGYVESILVIIFPPLLIFLAIFFTIVCIFPLLHIAQQLFLPYVYLIILSFIHLLLCLHHTLKWIDLAVINKMTQRWRDSSLLACHLIYYLENVIQQFHSWLLVTFFIVIYRMKVS